MLRQGKIGRPDRRGRRATNLCEGEARAISAISMGKSELISPGKSGGTEGDKGGSVWPEGTKGPSAVLKENDIRPAWVGGKEGTGERKRGRRCWQKKVVMCWREESHQRGKLGVRLGGRFMEEYSFTKGRRRRARSFIEEKGPPKAYYGRTPRGEGLQH